MDSKGQKKKRLTAAERRAAEEAEKVREQQEFEANREALWQKFWASAQRLELARTQCPDFVEKHQYEFEGFKVDILDYSFHMDSVGRVTQLGMTLNQANTLRWELEALENALKAFQDQKLKVKRQYEILQELRDSAAMKLTETEKMALGLHGRKMFFQPRYPGPDDLDAEASQRLDELMAKRYP